MTEPRYHEHGGDPLDPLVPETPEQMWDRLLAEAIAEADRRIAERREREREEQTQ